MIQLNYRRRLRVSAVPYCFDNVFVLIRDIDMRFSLRPLQQQFQYLVPNLNIGFLCLVLAVTPACEVFDSFMRSQPSVQIRSAINSYERRMELVDIGDSKEKFIELVYSSQKNLPLEHTRPPTKYFEDNFKVEVYYLRSG